MPRLSGSNGFAKWWLALRAPLCMMLAAACGTLPACKRREARINDAVIKAEMATAEARAARQATELAKAGLEADIAQETFRMLATAKNLAPRLTPAELVWLKAGVTECAYPPAERTPAQRLQAIRDFHAKLKDELRWRR